MAPYFEQYTSALRRGIEKTISGKETEKRNVQARIDELTKQIDGLQEQQTTRDEEVTQLTQSLDVFTTLPQVDIFVPGPENGPITISDFAKQATQERLTSTTADSQKSADEKLQSLFHINQILNNSGIDTARHISLDPNDDTQTYKESLSGKHEIQINGRVVVLTARERSVYTVLEQHEGIRINYTDIAKLIPNMIREQVGSTILSLRRKIEDNPRKPNHIIGRQGGYGVGGITFIKNPTS